MKAAKNKSPRKPVIAVAQIRYFDTYEPHNVAKIKSFIALAAKAKADIVCFPESCVHKRDVLRIDHRLLQEICLACKENNIWAIVTDTFEENGKSYNMALLINRKGKIKGKYRKINLYGDVGKEGRKTFVFKTDFAKIGIAICWDVAFPEIFSRMKKKGAEIIFVPTYWCYEYSAHRKDHKSREKKLLKSLVLTRAFENICFVALASPVSNKPGLVPYSAISCPHFIMKDISGKEGLLVKRINLGEIKKFEELYPNKKVNKK
ncbi:MAG TPA: carbon-nitrogen hydrolase family protein [Candidatus Paceibacterota bacterium]|nr:carbon-nitrogen hydrolase family protein [Candidatus Paceibacterota bacterium]